MAKQFELSLGTFSTSAFFLNQFKELFGWPDDYNSVYIELSLSLNMHIYKKKIEKFI
jgi:hypothetical protein